eukprot:7900873-Ditylum_brightwellii.AAC.1
MEEKLQRSYILKGILAERIGPNNLIMCCVVTHDEHFNFAVTCTTAPFHGGGLPERPISS